MGGVSVYACMGSGVLSQKIQQLIVKVGNGSLGKDLEA